MKNKKLVKKFYNMIKKKHAQLLHQEKKTIENMEDFFEAYKYDVQSIDICAASDLLALVEEKEALNREMEYTVKIIQVLGDELK